MRLNHKIPWYNQFLTPQTVLYLLAGMVAIVIFWTKTEASWERQKAMESEIEELKKNKADASDLNALNERVTRQYETSNKINERLNKVDQDAAYQRGLHEKQEIKN